MSQHSSLLSTPLASSGVKSNQQSILNYPVSFSTPTSTVNSQQSTIIPVQPELISYLFLLNNRDRVSSEECKSSEFYEDLHSSLETNVIAVVRKRCPRRGAHIPIIQQLSTTK